MDEPQALSLPIPLFQNQVFLETPKHWPRALRIKVLDRLPRRRFWKRLKKRDFSRAGVSSKADTPELPVIQEERCGCSHFY